MSVSQIQQLEMMQPACFDCFALIAQLVHAVFVSVGLQHLP